MFSPFVTIPFWFDNMKDHLIIQVIVHGLDMK